ncbi:MAG: NAD(P)H-binding protein, partial [Woeseiaceae bacterium]
MNLVIGATGSLGRLVSHRLIKAGAPVRALVRERSDYSSLQSGGAEVALGDLKNPRSLERACIGVKRIIATATAAGRGGDDTIQSVDRQGYANLLEAALATSIRQFVFVSGHGFSADAPVDLARAKAGTEEILRSSGFDYTILRPALFMESWISMILGAQLQLGPRVVIMGDPDQPLPFV